MEDVPSNPNANKFQGKLSIDVKQAQ